MDSVAQKKYIVSSCKKLSKPDAIDVGKTLLRYEKAEFIKYTSEGASINLDLLEKNDPNIIGVLYSQIKHKIEKNMK